MRNDDWYTTIDAMRNEPPFTWYIGADRLAQVLLDVGKRNFVDARKAIEHNRRTTLDQSLLAAIFQEVLDILQRRNFRSGDNDHLVGAAQQQACHIIEERPGIDDDIAMP